MTTLRQVAFIAMGPLQRISGPTPFKDLYDTLKSNLPAATRLRMDYLVDKLYACTLRSNELTELRAFSAATARLPINTSLPKQQNMRELCKRNGPSARIDLDQCARDGLLW
jgi:hypothetical protein